MADTYRQIIENLSGFAGSGGFLTLFIAALLFNLFTEKNRKVRFMLLWIPLATLIVFFCPAWGIYFRKNLDGEIMYRILWLLPVGVEIAYALVKLCLMLPGKLRFAGVAAGMLMIAFFGSYIYQSPYFSGAENLYHVPETIVKICNEIEVEGREIKACFPEELVPFVRQYSAYTHLTYGREAYMYGDKMIDEGTGALALLREEKIDMKALSEAMRGSGTQYLVVKSDRIFTETPWNYDFCYVTNIDGYDIYLDNQAYLGLDFINYR